MAPQELKKAQQLEEAQQQLEDTKQRLKNVMQELENANLKVQRLTDSLSKKDRCIEAYHAKQEELHKVIYYFYDLFL